ncbi:MAG: 4-(cytidine 5'-diphospho)-2-C-methyl-D-erythritol kinase [Rhodospirillales bacterium]|nr:4-(cytidine 5'-diphospho)-2-C-methyl-D-erythritol kinase [Rhodospirillales bacterium]
MSENANERVVELAPAKVNLYLHVIGRRADGYHLLDSLVVFASIGDRIEVRLADRLCLSIEGPFARDIPADEDNLVVRAARMLAAAAGIAPAVAIRLDKRLPVAAGIGGGSADAAATLRALLRLWRLDAAIMDLDRLALSLGADVPMCLAGRPVFVGGVGEVIEAAPHVPACGLVLVNPREALPTPRVFAARHGAFSAPARLVVQARDAAELASMVAERHNDLTRAATTLVPTIATVIERLSAMPGVLLARMSGSGATCFGLCADADTASDVSRDLKRRHPEWWIEPASVAIETRND